MWRTCHTPNYQQRRDQDKRLQYPKIKFWHKWLIQNYHYLPILDKTETKNNSHSLDSIKTVDQLHIDKVEEKALCLKLLQFGSALSSVAEHLEPHRLCTYLYELATTFSSFYEACSVLKADSETSRLTRLLLCDLTARTLEQGLALLGIRVLEKM